LHASKVTGFFRSARLLEDYIGRKDDKEKSTASLRKFMVDNFAQDYYDETIYTVIKSLNAEKAVFTSDSAKAVIGNIIEDDGPVVPGLLMEDLEKIQRINPWWRVWL